jgi:uncharacterized protein YjbI with pentapeptide repeats
MRIVDLIGGAIVSQSGSQPYAGLLALIQEAQRSVPAVKYALGVVGIAAAAGIVSGVLGHTRSALLLLTLIFVGMVLLFLFARLVSSGPSPSIQLAANVIMWTIVLVFSAALFLGLLAVAARWPPGVVNFLFPDSEISNAVLLQRVVTRDNLEGATDAIAELERRCEVRCDDRARIIKTLTTVLQNTKHLDRELNVAIVEFLKQLSGNDLQSILRGELEDRELVGVEFTNANLSGLSLKGAFAILSKFRNANLTNADLSSTSIRGADFRGAVLRNTSLANSDWYNSFNLDKTQISEVTGDLLPCPRVSGHGAFTSFIADVDQRYGIAYRNYTRAHQQELKDQWQNYTSPGGLCDFVEHRRSLVRN